MDGEKSASVSAKALPSLLEAVVEARFLLLFLCFAFYLDVWLLQYDMNPTVLSLQEAFVAFQHASVFSCALFVGSYSLLMVGFFPALRKLIGLARLYFESEIHLGPDSAEERKLADWSIAFVSLSTYDAVVGYFFTDHAYKGVAVYVLNFLGSDGVAEALFRMCVFGLWFVCLMLSLKVDLPE